MAYATQSSTARRLAIRAASLRGHPASKICEQSDLVVSMMSDEAVIVLYHYKVRIVTLGSSPSLL
jgi:hypothetical protein